MLYVMNFMSCTSADSDDNYTGFDDEEIEEFGFAYVLDAREEE